MRGVIYARYSEGPRQTDQSIEGQVADCRAFAEEKGIDILEVYADRHISGKSTEGRDEFLRMMRDADRHKFDVVIVWKIDRFGRSREDIAVNKIRLRKAGVVLMYAREALPEGPEGILLESLLEGLAEYYSADLRQKVLRGQRESAKKGIFVCGQIPIGYRRGADRRLEIDEPRAAAVREVFRLHNSGASLQELQQCLADHGILGRDGQLPSKSTVHRMLRNEKYLGRAMFQDIEVKYEPIIDERTFREAATHFRTSRNNAAGKAKTVYSLSCRCHCALCGRMLTGESGRGKAGGVYHYYKCRTKGCELKPIRQETLEELVLQHTVRDVLNDDMIEKLVRRIMEIQEADEDPVEPLRRALAENRKKQANIVRAIEDGAGRALVGRLPALEAEEDDLLLRIDKAALHTVRVPEEAVRAWLHSFRDGDTTDPVFRRRLVDTFVADVVVGPEELTVVYNAKNRTPSECSDMVRLVKDRERYPNTGRGPVVSGAFILLSVYRPDGLSSGGVRPPARTL